MDVADRTYLADKAVSFVQSERDCAVDEEFSKVLKFATRVLSKQIAFPPIELENSCKFICPDCARKLDVESNYCDRCGRAIDWRGVSYILKRIKEN